MNDAAPGASVLRRVLVGVISTALAASVVAGCSVPRGGDSATRDVAGCAAVLPVARDTVHDRGTITLIHSIGPKDANALYKELGAPPIPPPPKPPPGAPPPPPPDPNLPRTCIVVYDGNYPAGSVTGADPTAAGRYALIVARVRAPIVLRVLLTDRLPDNLPGS